MVFGENFEDLIKNWVILTGLLLHFMDYMMIPHAQSTINTGSKCLIIEENWRELMPKKGTLIETDLFEKYKKLEIINGEIQNWINLLN
ncbi:hypothetical protein ACQ4LE_004564 [Meloidogyne hapla]|uniref:Uncharacterized protein n=1 Tax=Meloidogyne hapla TaxID=6305 RepID=A0A1I8BFG9_MELHA